MTQQAVAHYLAEYARSRPAAADWLQQQREAAIDIVGRLGFPTTRQEAWKYTDVRKLLQQNFSTVSTGLDSIDRAQLDALRFPTLDCHELVFVNGRYSAALSSNGPLAKGVTVCSLADAGAQARELAGAHINRYARDDKHGFAALNSAFVADGAFIHLADKVELERPIHLVFISRPEQASRIAQPRNLVVLGKHAKAAVIETYAGPDELEYCTNTVSEILAGDGASLEHYKLQQEGMAAFHIAYLQAHCQQDSRLQSHSISLGGALVRNDIDVSLAGKGAHVGLNGLYMTSGSQHVDNHTRVDHRVPHTSSDEIYRGVLNGKSRAVFNGKVVVHRDAQKTDARQSNANLLLSDDAEIDTKPELEIYANDVKCTHGATVGQLDENMLFYMRTRAIDESTARSLLTFAFADEIIRRIRFAPIREILEYKVVGRLPDASLITEFVK